MTKIKKYLGLASLLTVILGVGVFTSAKDAGEIATLNATAVNTDKTTTVSVSGTVSETAPAYAVAVQLRDSEDALISLESCQVLPDYSFSLEMKDLNLISNSKYYVYASDYEGGALAKCEVTIPARPEDLISFTDNSDIEIVAESTILYDGDTHTPGIIVKYKGNDLTPDKDYTVSATAESAVGTYEAVITGKGDFRDSVSVYWSICPTSGLWCADIPDQVYTGSAIKPEIEVYSDAVLLEAGKDYTISYGKYNKVVADKDAKNSKGASIAPSVTITGKGNYTGKITKTFSIIPKSLSKAVVDDVFVASTGKDIKVAASVILDGKTLKAGTDYFFAKDAEGEEIVEKLKDVDSYDLYVCGKGNYDESVSFTYTITESVLASKVSISKIKDQKYAGGDAIEPEVKITYKKKDVTEKFDISYENNTEIGTATVIVTAKEFAAVAEGGDPKDEIKFSGSKKATFKITGTKISGAKLGSDGKGKIAPFTYTGNECEPDLDLYLAGEKLSEDVDYTVEYSKNVNAGKATATVTGMGAYTGSKKFTFTINKYDAAKDALEIMLIGDGSTENVPYVKGGAALNPVITMNGEVLAEKKDYTVKYSNNKAVAKADATNAKGKSIAPTATITYKGNFTGKKAVTYEITAKNIDECTMTVADKVAGSKAFGWKQTSFTITDENGKKLAAKTDFDKAVKYFSDDACTSEITEETLEPDTEIFVKAEGLNNYTGSVVGSYRIAEASISGAKVKALDKEFTGEEVILTESDITVTIKKDTLSPDTDYEIVPGSYKNNVNKGTASVVIRGKGKYCGTKTVKFKITSKGFTWWNLF